jgi:hypothetical protein
MGLDVDKVRRRQPAGSVERARVTAGSEWALNHGGFAGRVAAW